MKQGELRLGLVYIELQRLFEFILCLFPVWVGGWEGGIKVERQLYVN